MNTYRVYIMSTEKPGSEDIKTLVEFECDKERYKYEIKKAIKNSLPFTATDSIFSNKTGGRDYLVSIYIL